MINAGFANSCGIELFNIGWVQCPTAAVTPTPNTDGGGRGSGPIGRRARVKVKAQQPDPYRRPRKGYAKGNIDALEETRRLRILAEDDDVVALIMSMLNNGLM